MKVGLCNALAVAGLLLLTSAASCSAYAVRKATLAWPSGLYVRHGVLMHAGKPYHGVGANYFDAFDAVLQDPANNEFAEQFQKLSDGGVPFIRFMAGSYWPGGWKLYRTDKAAYFQRMDRVVRAAEKAHLGLIPDLFWAAQTVPDLVGEHLNEEANPRSKSIAFIKQYTTDMVLRYRDSPAIWGWEFGNEYNLDVDLPDAFKNGFVQAVVPALGTPDHRTADDVITAASFHTAVTVFAATVRLYDKDRLITTGNAIPRAASFHNSSAHNWARDTLAETALVLKRDNPDPVDTVSVHIYTPEVGQPMPGNTSTVEEALALMSRMATALHKPLFLGEFGIQRKEGNSNEQRARFQRMLDAVVKERVPLAAFWVFHKSDMEKDWNVTFENDRGYMLRMVREANARLSRK